MSELISLYSCIFCLFAASSIAFAMAWRTKKEVERLNAITQFMMYCMIDNHGYKYIHKQLEEWQEAVEESDLDETD